MTTLAHTTQISGGNAKRVFIGSAGKAATAVAVVGMISVFAVGLLNGAPFGRHHGPRPSVRTARPPLSD